MLARLFLLLSVVSAGLVLGACSRDKVARCSAGTFYQDAETVGRLRVPDDLTVPEEDEAFVIPAEGPPRETDEASVECLEYSPAFVGDD